MLSLTDGHQDLPEAMLARILRILPILRILGSPGRVRIQHSEAAPLSGLRSTTRIDLPEQY